MKSHPMPPTSTLSKQKKVRPHWHLIYYLLASFDIVVVSTGLYLNHQVMSIYNRSIEANQQWTTRRKNISELGLLAAQVNAPGNNVFDTRNVTAESQKMRAALILFNQQIASIQQELPHHVKPELSALVLSDLQLVNQRMTEMVSEANLIFSYFKQNKIQEAGERMATMDRKYANLTTALHHLQTRVGDIQKQLLDEQAAAAAVLQKLEYAIAIFVLFMVGGASFYGNQLAKRMRSDEMELQRYIQQLHRTQAQLVQTEKMSSLGQLVAGIAHEINNPVSFIQGNLPYARNYAQDLLKVIQLYQQQYPTPPEEIQAEIEALDLDFLATDFLRLLSSMKVGSERIQIIVQALRNFSRMDESGLKAVDIHEGIDSTLMILLSRLKSTSICVANTEYFCPEILVLKNFGELPPVECYPGQLNQVFLHILNNAIDALVSRCTNDVLDEFNRQRTLEGIKLKPNHIHIYTTQLQNDWVAIHIVDNGLGMSESVRSRLFDPFFTTKPVGQGTGLGLSICYQIVVENHGGEIQCYSTPGHGAEFIIKLPISQQTRRAGVSKNTNQTAQDNPFSQISV